jgi:hypothetical protein
MNRFYSKLLCITTISFASIAATDSFDSPFTFWDGTVLTTAGTIWEGVDNTTNAVSVSSGNGPNGELWIVVNNNFSSSNPQNDPPFSAPFLYFNASGEFSLTVQIDPTSPDADFENLGIAILADATSVAQVVSIFNDAAGSSSRFRGFDQGNGIGQFTDSVMYPWLRIERVAGLLIGYGSNDGAVWVELGTLSDFTQDTVQVGLFAASANTDGDFIGKFDNFAYRTIPPCPGDIANDFGTAGNRDRQISFGDFLALLGLIGPCDGGVPGCTGDIADDFGTLGQEDGQVSFGDFLALLGVIGPCPQ